MAPPIMAPPIIVPIRGSVRHYKESLTIFLDTKFVLHYFFVMKNVTITLDEEVARWARIMAAKENTSVSRLVGEMLREKMLEEQNYQIAMQLYLSQSPKVLKSQGEKLPGREALYDRKGLR
jgi:hypothetical protein